MLLPVWAHGQERMKVKVTLEPLEAAPGETVTLKVKLDIEPGFHTYPTAQTDPNASSFVTNIRVRSGPLESAGAAREPKPKEKFESALNATIGVYEEPAEIEAPFKVKADATPGKAKVVFRIQSQACNDQNCLPIEENPEFEITIKGGTADKSSDKQLATILLEAAGLGFLALLTPCVFPMIPITVSYFLKQKESQNALGHSFVYTGTIVISLSIFIYAFVDVAQKLNYHWATNLFLGLLLMVFALSLFGMFEIRLPTSLSNWTSAGQDRGGYLGTIFMALTFMIISFSCVSPIVGVLAGISAEQRPVYWNILTAVVFASCFASPFFVLSLFPTVLKKLPKSGGWLNSLKVILGLLEVAAALKFFRQSELNFKGNRVDYLSYDAVLACYIGLCFAGAYYLLRKFRLPHDDEDYSQKEVGVSRFMWACVLLSLGIYLFPGMFWAPTGNKNRPVGKIFAWVDAFLLSGDDTQPLKIAVSSGTGAKASADGKWFGFLDEALKEAKAKKKRIFVDFTGINCQNCALNEKDIFSQNDVKEVFDQYVLLKLYTDTVPLIYYPSDKLANITLDIQEEDGKKNRLFENERFKTPELPFYAVIEPDGDDFKIIKKLSVGLIQDKAPFLKDLRDNVGKKK